MGHPLHKGQCLLDQCVILHVLHLQQELSLASILHVTCVIFVVQYFTRLCAIPGYVPLVLAGTREACNVHSLSYNTSRIIGPSDERSGLMWPVEGA